MTHKKRQRGAPKGNHNALKHGYYSRAFKKASFDYDLASSTEDIDKEITRLCYELNQAVIKGDTKKLLALVKAAGALEKLLRARRYLDAEISREISNPLAAAFVPAKKASFPGKNPLVLATVSLDSGKKYPRSGNE
jgi:hypothetical protein